MCTVSESHEEVLQQHEESKMSGKRGVSISFFICSICRSIKNVYDEQVSKVQTCDK